jgi:hypothetical protein
MPSKSSTTATAASKKTTGTKPKKSVKKDSPQTGTTQHLGLSDLHLRHVGLEKEHQKILKQIKTKQSEIDRLGDKMGEIMREVASKSLPLMQQLQEVDAKTHEMFKQILTGRKLGKKTRKDIEKIYVSLQMQEIISPNPDADFLQHFGEEEEDEEEFDAEFEDFANRFRANFEQDEWEDRSDNFRDLTSGNQTIDRDEQKKMRQVFLRLADIFHPDKCLDSELAEEYAEIMKEVNQAYQSGDFAKLLEIERRHQAGIAIDLENSSDLEHRCDSLEHQNTVLKNQYERLKRDLRKAKSTQEGQMTKEYAAMTKAGIDPIDVLTKEIREKIDIAVEVQEFVGEFHQRKMTIADFLKGPACLQSSRELFLEELFGGMDVFFDDDDW